MADSFHVRVATPDDESALSGMLRACYPALMAGSYDTDVLAAALPLMTRANPKLLAAGTFYVAETDDGRQIGCGGWTRENPAGGAVEPGLAHIRHFGTDPAWAGRGVARALYARCEADARTAGIGRFDCNSSLNAEGFYAAMGFAAVARVEVPMTEDITFPAVLMRREI